MSKVGLEKQEFISVGEVLYKTVLPNGLRLFIIPKTDYQETYGIMTTKFGSVDTRFTDSYRHLRDYPAGIAHFLEHKLFEDEAEQDLLQRFVALGAESNAFTGYTRTSYLFSTSDQAQVPACLDLLQDMVSKTFFTEESVEREKAIIGQEIEMYQDQPDERLFYQTLANLYPDTPLAQDIAGTQESIEAIDVVALKENFAHFYQAANLGLVVVGNVNPEQILQQVLSKQASLQIDNTAKLGQRQDLELYPVIATSSTRMDVASPKLAIGLRGKDFLVSSEMLRYKTILRLLFAMLFGWTSKRFQNLYEDGKIDHSLTLEVEVEETFHFVILTMEAEEPVSLSHTMRSAIKNFAKDPDVTEEHLDTIKSEMFGDFLHGLNSLDYIATEYNPHLEGDNLFDLPQILQSIRLKDVLEVGHRFIDQCDIVDFTIFPR